MTKKKQATADTSEKKPVVKLLGADGNAFAIMGLCRRAAMKAKWAPERWAAVQKQMTSGDYQNLLATAMEHFDVR